MMVKMIVTAQVPTIGGINLTKEFTTCRGVRLGSQAVQRGGALRSRQGRRSAPHRSGGQLFWRPGGLHTILGYVKI